MPVVYMYEESAEEVNTDSRIFYIYICVFLPRLMVSSCLAAFPEPREPSGPVLRSSPDVSAEIVCPSPPRRIIIRQSFANKQ